MHLIGSEGGQVMWIVFYVAMAASLSAMVNLMQVADRQTTGALQRHVSRMGGLEVGLIRDLATPTTLCRVRALARHHGRLSQTCVLVQQKLPSAWSFEHRQIQGRGDEGGPKRHRDGSLLWRSFGRGHRPEIMFGVLVVILRRDFITGLGFSLGQREIPLIISLRVVRAVSFWASGTRCPPLRAASK